MVRHRSCRVTRSVRVPSLPHVHQCEGKAKRGFTKTVDTVKKRKPRPRCARRSDTSAVISLFISFTEGLPSSFQPFVHMQGCCVEQAPAAGPSSSPSVLTRGQFSSTRNHNRLTSDVQVRASRQIGTNEQLMATSADGLEQCCCTDGQKTGCIEIHRIC